MEIINTIKSIYFNLRYLPFRQAIYMPIWVTTNVRICSLKRGQIILKQPYRKSVFLGACGSPGVGHYHASICIGKGGKLILHGITVIGEGTTIRCDKGATIEMGSNFYCNKNCILRSSDTITFGEDCSLGWNVQINTNDGHPIAYNGIPKHTHLPIKINNHVWITSNVIICKGVDIASGCIVSQSAVVTKSIATPNTLVGGIPAKPIKFNVEWKKQ